MIWLSLDRAKSNEFALLPGHVLYREPGGHEIGGQKKSFIQLKQYTDKTYRIPLIGEYLYWK